MYKFAVLMTAVGLAAWMHITVPATPEVFVFLEGKNYFLESISIALIISSSFFSIGLLYNLLARVFAKTRHKQKIIKPEGHAAKLLLEAIFPKKVFDLHFAQIIGDMREDANEYINNKQKWLRLRSIVWYHLTLVYAFAAFFILGAGKKLAQMWKVL